MTIMAPNDTELLRRARKGDEASFSEMYYGHRTPVFRFAYRLTGSVPAAEDVTQECFLALLKSTRFDSRYGSLRTYLFGIARHLALRRLQLAQRESVVTSEDAALPNPLTTLLAQEKALLVERAISELPLHQREALILFEYEDLSLEEISNITGCEIGAVKARLYRARESLRQRLMPVLSQCNEKGV